MAKKKRLPKQSGNVNASKKAEIKAHAANVGRRGKHVSADARKPVSSLEDTFKWSAKMLDHAHDGSWNWKLAPTELRELFCFIEEMSCLAWKDILQQTSGGHNKHHTQKTDSLEKEAQDRLYEVMSKENEDFPEEVFRFRLNAKTRLWGIRTGSIFRILWYDRDHAVYRVKKRHT
ncbi:hypothetical protein BK816_01105 [Boudabousia tangfeifanii]|uniref:Uncharacterized protein n=1 Tax=Boudabousia tangfeifanii TaxID=1912795 RepID=A0A1D9MIF3_9ACTO|nr:hypothetical protein [Boudabousia tangfeifanii]AOZ72064.1 hypothetical protein BK816_01105 [Boudabousia tangfeifanii]